jgi:hypothetical protein
MQHVVVGTWDTFSVVLFSRAPDGLAKLVPADRFAIPLEQSQEKVELFRREAGVQRAVSHEDIAAGSVYSQLLTGVGRMIGHPGPLLAVGLPPSAAPQTPRLGF